MQQIFQSRFSHEQNFRMNQYRIKNMDRISLVRQMSSICTGNKEASAIGLHVCDQPNIS